MKRLKVAIAGNPNSGKSTIFNWLAGMRQKVANYPGVTVEIKEGRFEYGGCVIEVVDLPGTYSLSTRSEEERVAREFIVFERPDVVVDVVDASNFERNFYLATQIIELGVKLVVVLNMSDVARNRGQVLDTKALSDMLGVEVVETVGTKGVGIEDLKRAIIRASSGRFPRSHVDYGKDIEKGIAELAQVVALQRRGELEYYDDRWLALKLLEGDGGVVERIKKVCTDAGKILEKAYVLRKCLSHHLGDSLEIIIAERRYGFVSGLYREIAISKLDEKIRATDKIDDVVVNRFLGVPLFMIFMYLVFYLTFALGQYPMDWIEAGFGWLADNISKLAFFSDKPLLKSLVVDGIIGGVGGVLVFLPNVLILFFAIALLEDSGYLARAAFIIDRVMHKIGLHGKSFIPMLIGFGCTVPGVFATRVLENKEDRMTTIMVLPLMSCGARIPVYTLIIAAMFPSQWRAYILFAIYVSGVVLAILLTKLLRVSVFKGKNVPFVMELPPYRMPTLRGLLVHMCERTFMYLKKAGTIILAVSVLMWVFNTFPQKKAYDIDHASVNEVGLSSAEIQSRERMEALEYSIAGRVGRAMETVLKPIGFDWRICTALLGALSAKEVFVAQLAIVFSMGEEGETFRLRDALAENYSPLVGICIMLFMLIASPCLATMVVVWKETGSILWAVFQWVGLTLLAYFICLVVYRVGGLIG